MPLEVNDMDLLGLISGHEWNPRLPPYGKAEVLLQIAKVSTAFARGYPQNPLTVLALQTNIYRVWSLNADLLPKPGMMKLYPAIKVSSRKKLAPKLS